ncbi:MAG: type II toxin-antitoxin system Phd/YefM family antitoxin, partial [Planctomycetaceae bacterium]|nr:type II toxin-antitoxin system Phd/YefM family antitoxin [Planctomycetaceae bacterium]
MKTATATQVKARFEAYLKQSETAPVIVTKRGKPVAMLVAVQA